MTALDHSKPYLVADVGGTNTRIALTTGLKIHQDSIRRYSNAEHSDLAQILRLYMDTVNQPELFAATVAMAGAIENGAGYLTNRDWHFDIEILSDSTNTKNAFLINDLSAQGYALPLLPKNMFEAILDGPEAPADALRLAVGMGTGFNSAPIHTTPDGYFIAPAECGHAAFSGQSEDHASLIAWLKSRTDGFVSVEDVLSGRGLQNCYAFMIRNSDHEPLSAAQIVGAARENDPIATATLNLFASACGATLGDLALNFLPFGGMTLVGGVARSTLPFLQSKAFATAFKSKGRLSSFMDRFSVDIVTDDHTALIGCAAHIEQTFGNA